MGSVAFLLSLSLFFLEWYRKQQAKRNGYRCLLLGETQAKNVQSTEALFIFRSSDLHRDIHLPIARDALLLACIFAGLHRFSRCDILTFIQYFFKCLTNAI